MTSFFQGMGFQHIVAGEIMHLVLLQSDLFFLNQRVIMKLFFNSYQ